MRLKSSTITRLRTILIYFVVFVFSVYALFPVVWIVEGSFKSTAEIYQIPPAWIPGLHWIPTLRAYNHVASVAVRYLTNSLIVSAFAVVLALVVGLPAAYSLARFSLKRKRDVLIWILSTRMAPPFAFIVPIFLIIRDLALLDTHTALILVYLVFNLSFVIWILKGFIEELPKEIEESALVDGCTRLGAMRRITIPLIAPGIVVTLTLTFIFSWNEFLFANILTREVATTLPPAVAKYLTYMKLDWDVMCALSTIAIMPVLVLSLTVRRYLARGLTLGAIKG